MPYIKRTTSIDPCMALIPEGCMYGTPPSIPGLVQTNITNSAEEKWTLLDKDIEMEDSETENENRNGRTILHYTISLHYNVM